MFRGKESSNRIKISCLVQDLLNFGVLDSLRLWGGGRWVGDVWRHLWACGVSLHTCTHMCMHTHTCLHKKKLQMATNMEAPMFIMFNMHVGVCVHACMCMCVHGAPFHIPPSQSTHLPTLKGGPPESVKIQ